MIEYVIMFQVLNILLTALVLTLIGKDHSKERSETQGSKSDSNH